MVLHNIFNTKMIREFIIFNILLVLIPTINAIHNVQLSSSGIKNLNKCCPMGKHVWVGKKCKDYKNKTLTFSKTKIYDEDVYLTEKSFEDLFTLVPKRIGNTTFRRSALMDVKSLGFNVYLTETGVIQVELPNAYDRWTTVPIDGYCIDLDPRKSVEARFWTQITSRETLASSSSNIYLTIASLVSCFFILLVLVVYIILPELQNLCGLILMAYLFSLFMAFSMLIVIQLPNVYIKQACLGLASGMYYFFLAAFCWMSVMSYDMWWTFRSVLKARSHRRNERFKFLMYCVYAWGVPLLMTIFLVVVNSYRNDMRHLPWFITPRIPEDGCFLRGGVKLLYFYIPMLILIICNWIFYLMTAFHIRQFKLGTAVLDSSAAGHKQAHRDQMQMLLLYIKLSVVMGLSWLLEIISFLYPDYSIWYITDAYNNLIGLPMFLIFVCKKKILKRLSERYGGRKITRWTSKSTSRSKVDSSQENIALQSTVSCKPNGLNSSDEESEKKAHII